LAYVEWFQLSNLNQSDIIRCTKVSRSIKNGDRLASIIPVTNIRHSIHLLPKFGPVAPVSWKSHTVWMNARHSLLIRGRTAISMQHCIRIMHIE
ncbi:hypothetical protein B0H14DRAFT_2424005, partial [Mycena olivaceomarginata]